MKHRVYLLNRGARTLVGEFSSLQAARTYAAGASAADPYLHRVVRVEDRGVQVRVGDYALGSPLPAPLAL